ncbi:hypothetical protein EW026_g6812 [Hermanssonia centrifuga]|uniref:Uncharacterized protein n=1 Tax=Hermanssonia centrifuga TaxID=98765 RepID=A0A4S4K9U0_9APHY|nr:hypothetical protein EW026_g6812 [Hermanssonia centrifuga]
MPPAPVRNAWPPQGGPNDTVYAPELRPPSDLRQIRAFTTWQQEQHEINPTENPPTWQEYQIMKQIQSGYTPEQRATPLAPPNIPPLAALAQPAIDPAIIADERLNLMHQEMQEMKAELARMKAAAEEADDERSDNDDTHRRKAKRKRTAPFILCVKNKKLSPNQQIVKEELRNIAKKEMQNLTGLTKNPFPINQDLCDSTDEEDTSSSNAQPVAAAQMPVDLKSEVDSPTNRAIIERVALLVYREQTNPETCTLTIKDDDITFTQRDVEELAKLKEQRKQGIEQFKKDHDGVDPSCLLRTPWMSEAISELTTGSEATKITHQRHLAEKAGRTLQDILDGEKILEKRPLAWRSHTVNEVFEQLDKNRRKILRKRKKSITTLPRYDLGRVQQNPPGPTTPRIYSFMISRRWYKNHEGDTLDDDWPGIRGNPSGFTTSGTDSSVDEEQNDDNRARTTSPSNSQTALDANDPSPTDPQSSGAE